MRGIDPKWIMWLGLLVTIEHGISAGTLSLTNMIPDAWIITVKAWSSGLEFIGTAIMTWWAAVSSPQAGPMINTPLAPVTKLMILLAVLVASAFAFPGDARAQIKLHAPAVTGNLAKDIQTDLGNASPTASPSLGTGGLLTPDALIKKIVALAAPDLTYTAALATSANTNSSAIRLACVKAIQALNAQASGANLKNADGSPMIMPAEPHIFTDLEIIAEGIDSLSPTGPLYTSCAGAAALAQQNVLTFINSVVTGTAAAALVVPK